MKKAIILLGAALLSGCTLPPYHESIVKGDRYGTPDGLPCIRCGEDFIFVPNEPMAAIRQSERIYKFKWGDPELTPVY